MHDHVCGVFLDRSKAFDTVNHDILIKKFEFFRVRGHTNKWLISYLSNRRQVFCVDNTLSDERIISRGVPQGSFLGPLLFLNHINDIAKSSQLLDFHIFADDANLLHETNNLLSLQTKLNHELAKVYEWLCLNKSSLNTDKSNLVIFHSKQRKTDTNVQVIAIKTRTFNQIFGNHVRF